YLTQSAVWPQLLHPRYKLSYFRQANWPQEWEKAALQFIHENWEQYYVPLIQTPAMSKKTSGLILDSDDDDSFSDVKNFGRSTFTDVLEAYLNEPTINNDPIKFWTSHLDPSGAGVSARGALARMGLDFCSTPDDVVWRFREKSSHQGNYGDNGDDEDNVEAIDSD
ncbi:hypothetical protein K435DRAFT_795025, partial [Dendrothele bispora CBS 962.96]